MELEGGTSQLKNLVHMARYGGTGLELQDLGFDQESRV